MIPLPASAPIPAAGVTVEKEQYFDLEQVAAVVFARHQAPGGGCAT